MAHLIIIEPVKTYASRDNAIKAVERKFPAGTLKNQSYIIMIHTDGRFFPCFIGERAIQDGLHFHFNIIG